MSKALLLSGALFSIGCANTDAAVFVDPAVEAPKVAVKGGALGVGISGSFTLDLHLGARASGTSTVKLGEFELEDGGESPIVSPLPIAGDKTFPVEVEQDADVVVHFTFDSGTKPLPAEKKDELCKKAGVLIKGTIQDSLSGAATPVISETFDPSGC